ncbi:MAG: GTPase-activating protein S13 [Icmadophila ericetorum]|nr:GTPase-activating protein S13 [Icmadophila ericetorum]
MTQVITNSGHDDMIHDAVLDYYGRRLATCLSDKTIKIFDIEGETHKLSETLRGHDGAVWCVSWAHPKFGAILASSSYDGHVFIWRSSPPTHKFTRVFDFGHHTASVNLLSWAPHECGCILACASSDSSISVLEFTDGSWTHVMLQGAHGLGVNSVSWAPAARAGSLVSSAPEKGAVRRFVSGGSDCMVKIWDWDPEQKTYVPSKTLEGHTGWVRDVSWSPSILSKSYIASASQDKTVRIWTADPLAQEWKSTILTFEAVLWRVSWSLSGNVLAVSGGDNKVSLWKENLKGEWDCVKWIEE